MYIHMHTVMFMYTFTYDGIYMYMYIPCAVRIYIYINTFIHTYTCTHNVFMNVFVKHIHAHIYMYTHTYTHIYVYTFIYTGAIHRQSVSRHIPINMYMEWLRSVGSLKLYVPFAKKPYKRDDILQKRPIILRSLLVVATPTIHIHICTSTHAYIQAQHVIQCRGMFLYICICIHIYKHICV